MTRALFVTEHGDRSVLAVRDHDVPAPAPDEVQVRVVATGVNFIDVYKREGVYPGPTPFVAGEEGAGTVEAVGAKVSDLRPGARVAWASGAGSASELVNVPAAAVVPVPDGVDLPQAAAAMLQGMTAHYLVESTYPVREGDIALVHAAAGGVGQLLVQLIVAKGAQVVATAGTADKLAIASRLGAQHTIGYHDFDGKPEELAAAVRDAAGRGVDVVYDGVGQATFDASLRSLRPRGLMALFGAASGQVPPFDLQRLNRLGSLFVTRPTLASYIATREELLWRAGAVLSAVERGSLHVDVSASYPFDEAVAAYEALEGRATTGKLLLTP
ncbi:quinone oxidoreductase [Allobranchiibius sp. GilTou73]|uniref:quinone oxidoreductase family protein n=1 Tax=Allobranchiibius sp. GilTou73 TaxID=2904523 RepID=UPI001F1919C5|nr:quinone oxidoreductase [Allobranchiibius sp. GilTou73]UIJ34025.1 quinone oxidoreductase [Allobranchiibius sp. GilTou73]